MNLIISITPVNSEEQFWASFQTNRDSEISMEPVHLSEEIRCRSRGGRGSSGASGRTKYFGNARNRRHKICRCCLSNAEESANLIRYHYMDLVSELYSVNFSQRIADWCSAHHIEHIGHVIEDNNASGRLGYGAGHFSDQ